MSWRDRVPGATRDDRQGQPLPLTALPARLRDPAEPVKRLLDAAAGLGGQLGPVLLQLPPDLRAGGPGLAAGVLLRQFPATVRVAVEPRHESWWTDEAGARGARGGERRAVLGGPRRVRGHAAVADGRAGDPCRYHEGDGVRGQGCRDAAR